MNISNVLCERKSYKRWMIVRRVLFPSIIPFELKILSQSANQKLHNKCIVICKLFRLIISFLSEWKHLIHLNNYQSYSKWIIVSFTKVQFTVLIHIETQYVRCPEIEYNINSKYLQYKKMCSLYTCTSFENRFDLRLWQENTPLRTK
jgi:hypothetical protein